LNFRTTALAALIAFAPAASAQRIDSPPPIAREMRAVWIATVDNLDWPSRPGLTTAQQQRELTAMFDRAAELRMNAVIFQVRPGADALYDSKIEPWSEYLTGEMGRAPSPYYDPLKFAIEEAHKRGLELHAWINPYRARYSTKRKASKTHISRAHPDLVRKYGSYLWMDPGDAEVRAQTKKVVLDIVRRYDVDGIHLDDYFYPYKEQRRGRDIPFPDNTTWKRYVQRGGKLSRADWRRDNVNKLVDELNTAVHEAKSWVRFGISPFGIWRPGYPASVRGLDQYNELFADARKWWNEGWVDYLVPQLYWAVDRPQQSYVQLLQWWADENRYKRHLWAGNYTGKVGFSNSQKFPVSEIQEQIRLTRENPGASGNVHFSMKVFMDDPDMLNEKLARETYAEPALVPASPWLDDDAPDAPTLTLRTDQGRGEQSVEMRLPIVVRKDAKPSAPWLWVIQSRDDSNWATSIIPASSNLFTLRPRVTDVRVRAVDRVGNVGAESRLLIPREKSGSF
jgi:uncharacterized lipoprotein YddW (UPF0748 family)